ncbi:MAG: G1 family glutamic endopeptidase [Acidimicrobiales bacterium]|jgi:hypothetical protein
MFGYVARRLIPLAAIGVALIPAIGGGSAIASATGPTHGAAQSRLGFGAFTLSNWAGYIALGTKAEFTTVAADWTVPAVTCLKDGDLYAPWVGIDGDGSGTVEQTGVQTSCASGKPVESAWYEMYPKSPKYYSKPIAAGDAITASVTEAKQKFTLTISDTTKGWTETVTKKLKTAKEVSAEAVIEAPGGFPAISSVDFTNVLFNGQDLSSFNPVASESDTGGTTIYGPTSISDGTNFDIVPQS